MENLKDDNYFMELAIRQAEKALRRNEVPVGAVLVTDGRIISTGFNRREIMKDATAHAEILALRRAGKKLGSWRLTGTTIYVTLEPCPMCAGALVLARVERLVYGAVDPKAGAVHSLYNITSDCRLNHSLKVTGGVLEAECSAMLKDFFRARR